MTPGDPADPDSADATRDRRDDNVLAAAKGGGFMVGGSYFEFASRFVIALLLARLLGPGDYGLYVLAISAATLFAAVSQLGLDDAMVRYVAILSGRRDDAGVNGTIQIGLVTATFVSCVMGAVLYVASGPIADGLFDEPRLGALLRILAFVVPFLTVSNVLLGTARGYGLMGYAAIGENVVMSLVRMALLGGVALVTDGLSVGAAVVVFAISDISATVTMLVLLNRRVPVVHWFRLDVRRDFREVFRFALPLWLSGLLRQFRRNIEAIFLGAARTATSVGIYSIVDRITMIARVWVQSLYVSVKPTMARLHDRGERAELGHLYTTATRWSLTLTLPFVLGMILYRGSLLRIFGEAYTAGSAALVILAVAELVNAGTGVCGPVIDMTGHTRVKFANSVVWTVITITGAALLIPRWGIIGSAVSSLVAISSVNIMCIVEIWVLERLAPFDRTFLKPVSAGVAAFAAGVALQWLFPTGNRLLPAVLQGGVVAAVFAGVLLALGLADEDRLVFRRVFERVLGVVRGRKPARTAAARRETTELTAAYEGVEPSHG